MGNAQRTKIKRKKGSGWFFLGNIHQRLQTNISY
jgi:hypothetical protein